MVSSTQLSQHQDQNTKKFTAINVAATAEDLVAARITVNASSKESSALTFASVRDARIQRSRILSHHHMLHQVSKAVNTFIMNNLPLTGVV